MDAPETKAISEPEECPIATRPPAFARVAVLEAARAAGLLEGRSEYVSFRAPPGLIRLG
jgi:hypothetical protein